jgi:hypothetical protein
MNIDTIIHEAYDNPRVTLSKQEIGLRATFNTANTAVFGTRNNQKVVEELPTSLNHIQATLTYDDEQGPIITPCDATVGLRYHHTSHDDILTQRRSQPLFYKDQFRTDDPKTHHTTIALLDNTTKYFQHHDATHHAINTLKRLTHETRYEDDMPGGLHDAYQTGNNTQL